MVRQKEASNVLPKATHCVKELCVASELWFGQHWGGLELGVRETTRLKLVSGHGLKPVIILQPSLPHRVVERMHGDLSLISVLVF